MKKIKNVILSLLLASLLFVGFVPKHKQLEVAEAKSYNYSDYVTDASKLFDEFCVQNARVAGSDAEKAAAEFIRFDLASNGAGLVPKDNASTKAGVQEFKFYNEYTGAYGNSQNVIFEYKSAVETKKKVILACNYDAPYKFDEETNKYVSFENDAVNTSASGVVSLLMLARTLPTMNLNFNLEFVFFGAGEVECAGSEFYLNGVSEEDAKNTLCVINLDKIALGKNIYFYIDEISTKFSKYVASTCSSYAREVNLVHLNKSSYVDTKLNLGYSHIGLTSDNVNFMSRGIATINFFAGEYESGLIMGLNEFNGKTPVSYTENDNWEYVSKTYGSETIFDNLYKTNMAIEELLSDEKFEENANNAYKQTSWFYSIFADDKLVVYLMFVAFIVMLIIAMYIYYKLTAKSYYANIEVEFLSSVVKIADHIDKNEENKDVAKVVGQVLANDIKKDKTLKREKKKKK